MVMDGHRWRWRLPRLKSTVLAAVSPDGINYHILSLQIGEISRLRTLAVVGSKEGWPPPGLLGEDTLCMNEYDITITSGHKTDEDDDDDKP